MAIPEPVPGLVVRYSYLWLDEYRAGREEGTKDRPCAIVLLANPNEGERVVTVLPITHAPPANPEQAVEVPLRTKQRLGLDEDRAWIILSEANRFVWPGPDLRPARPRDDGNIAYGMLPYRFFELVRQRFLAAIRARRAGLAHRTE